MILASSGPSAFWYLTRSSGTVALLLLTGAVVLGILDVRRTSSTRWPRFLIDSLHRNVSLLAIAFLALHVLTSILDGFASISPLDVLVPFVGSYRPFWLGLGALALDLLLAVTVTSLLRRRMGYRSWYSIHALTYVSWPVAFVHGLGTGSDVKSTWLLALSVLCLVGVLAAVLLRAHDSWRAHPERSRAVVGTAGAFAVFLAAWVPLGPLGAEWARRSGTPAKLLGHKSQSTGQDTKR